MHNYYIHTSIHAGCTGKFFQFDMQTFIHTYVQCTYIHTYVHTCMNTYIHTYIHIHAYIHTYINTSRVFIKNCVFSQFTATHPLQIGKQLICARDLSVYSHSYWLTILCTTGTTNGSPVLAKERSQNIEFLEKKKHNI